MSQGRAFMEGNMTGFQTFYFILRRLWCCVMLVPIHQKWRSMYFSDPSANVTGFRIPRNDIPDFEIL